MFLISCLPAVILDEIKLNIYLLLFRHFNEYSAHSGHRERTESSPLPLIYGGRMSPGEF